MSGCRSEGAVELVVVEDEEEKEQEEALDIGEGKDEGGEGGLENDKAFMNEINKGLVYVRRKLMKKVEKFENEDNHR